MRPNALLAPGRALIPIALPFLASLLGGCYLTHVAGGQLGVISDTVSVQEALKSGALTAADRDKLEYIQDVKRFAEKELGLTETCNYSTYLLRDKAPLTYVVSAARRDALVSKTWWYPIVGTASYKGFFDETLAAEESAELLADGYDVYLRTAAGYSTLGWFCDPVLPAMLDYRESTLADLIIHELTHSTLYVSGDTEFNESLADFVAHTAAPRFLETRFGPGNRHLSELAEHRREERIVNGILRALADRLRSLYATSPSEPLLARESEFASARRELGAACAAHGINDSLCAPDAQLDNAVVLGRLTYGSPERFERLFREVGGDWRIFFASLRAVYDKSDWYPLPSSKQRWP